MKNLTIEELELKVSCAILIKIDYNSLSTPMDHKSIRYYPLDRQYRIYQYGIQVNESYEASTAVKYYNELTFIS